MADGNDLDQEDPQEERVGCNEILKYLDSLSAGMIAVLVEIPS